MHTRPTGPPPTGELRCSPTTVQGEDWITRADMAALMRKSEDTVRRAEKKHQLETRETTPDACGSTSATSCASACSTPAT